jgi:hypothetical protein
MEKTEKEGTPDNDYSQAPFVRIPRAIVNGPFGLEKRVYSKFEACIDLINMARYSTSEKKEYVGGKLITWGRGQVAASYRYLAVRWRWSVNKVQRFMDLLIVDEMISVDHSQGQTVGTLLEKMWIQQRVQPTDEERIQRKSIPDGVPSDSQYTDEYSDEYSKQYTNSTVTNTKQKEGSNKGNKVDKVIKEIHYAFVDLKFKKVFDEWIKYRRELKKPLTETTIEKQMTELKGKTVEDAIAILNQSMLNGWIGLQPLKNQENGKSTSGTSKTREQGIGEFVFSDYQG